MPDLPSEPDGEEVPAPLAALRAANTRLREVIEVKDAQLAAAVAALAAAEARITALGDRVAELERRLGKDSGTSSKPPSSDSPYNKKPRDRSLRGRSGRNRGKQPGAESSTLRQVADPDEVVVCAPAACGRCGADLAGARVTGVQKLQEFEIVPPPPPRVTEYQVQARDCGRCGAVSAGQAPARITGRAQYGPEAHAQAANLASAHYVPVGRAAQLMGDMTGLRVSAGWMAGVRHKAAARLDPFMDHVRGLLRQAGVLYADETPARAAGHLEYVHVACTGFLTAMHTGGRSAADIDAGGSWTAMAGRSSATATPATAISPTRCTPGAGRTTSGTCGTCIPSAPAGSSGPGPWPTCSSMPTPPRPPPAPPASPGSARSRWPRSAPGTAARSPRASPTTSDGRSKTAKDGRRLARRFRDNQDMILRFATDLAVGFTSNQAERDIRPVKVQQRTSGGCWRTLDGLADFAIVQSYLSTAAKWGLNKIDSLRQLFTTGPWLPPATAPP